MQSKIIACVVVSKFLVDIQYKKHSKLHNIIFVQNFCIIISAIMPALNKY
jgi:hypothetical protein